jgi:hypothetical protein
VLFTIIDGTLNNTNIKFKGEMTAWDTVSMSQNINTWTLTLNVAPGTYKWGAIEDDGSPSGIWLIEGPDLEVTVDETGIVSGTVTYTTLITGLDETVAQISVYPNPTTGTLYLDIPHKAVIRITDMHGAMLLQKESLGGVEQLDLTDFRSGIYNLEIRNGVTIRKFSVIKK